ncbi:MAG: CHAD domain-containing protein [Acidimicrobiales bacterium]
MPGRLPAPIEFVLDPGISADDVLAALATVGDVDDVDVSSSDRTYLDTFDRRLEARGLTLERSATMELALGEAGRTVQRGLAHPASADRIFAHELEPARLRDRLAGVAKERALLSQGRVRSVVTTTVIRNGDEKIIVRLVLDAPSVVRRAHTPEPLAARVRVAPVLGYEQSFRAAAGALEAVPGVRVAHRTLAADAAQLVSPCASPLQQLPVLTREMTAGHATALVCRHLADTVDANLGGALVDIDTEFLHDVRVAIRRTRTVVREIKGVLPEPTRRRAQSDLRWIQQVTGPTRDLDVQLLAWPAATASLGAGAAGDLEPLHDLLVRKRQQAWRAMRRHLRGSRFTETWAAWRTLIDGPLGAAVPDAPNATRPIDVVAGDRIRRVYRDMVRAGSVIDSETPPEALHDLRKRGKELRYLLELFGSLWPVPATKRLIGTVKDFQDLLGRFQDCEVEATYLRSLAPELVGAAGGPDALLALGQHLDRLAADQSAAREAFASQFAAFSSRHTSAAVRTTFGPQPAPERRGSGELR